MKLPSPSQARAPTASRHVRLLEYYSALLAASLMLSGGKAFRLDIREYDWDLFNRLLPELGRQGWTCKIVGWGRLSAAFLNIRPAARAGRSKGSAASKNPKPSKSPRRPTTVSTTRRKKEFGCWH